MRLATELAAMRRGWVWPIMRARSPGLAFSRPRPSISAILGSWVVLPEPVSPQTMMTWCWSMAAMISSRRAETGRPSGKSIWRGMGFADSVTGRLSHGTYSRATLIHVNFPDPGFS